MKLLERWRRYRRQRVSWFEPAWAYRRNLAEALRIFFNPWSVLRVSALIVVSILLMQYMCRILVPGMLFPLGRMLAAIPGFYAYCLLMSLLISARQIIVRPKTIVIATSSSSVIVAADILCTRLVVFAEDRVCLRVYYKRLGRNRRRSFGVGKKVDLDKLVELLPVKPTIVDAREHYVRLNRPSHAKRSPCPSPTALTAPSPSTK